MTLRTSSDYIGLRYVSVMNDWIDFTVIVLRTLQDEYREFITETMDAFWERDNDMGYGEMLEYAFPGAAIIYRDDEEEDDEVYDALLDIIEWVAIN